MNPSNFGENTLAITLACGDIDGSAPPVATLNLNLAETSKTARSAAK